MFIYSAYQNKEKYHWEISQVTWNSIKGAITDDRVRYFIIKDKKYCDVVSS